MFKKILFPIDINDKSFENCFPAVIDIAKRFNASLHIVTVIPDYGTSMVEEYFPKGWIKEITSKAESELKRIVGEYVPKDIEVDIIVRRGAIYHSIINTSDQIQADLIIIYANRPELREYFLGSNASKVVRHAQTSVLVVRN